MSAYPSIRSGILGRHSRGWAGVKRTYTPYDHSLKESELAAVQERMSGLLFSNAFLEGFWGYLLILRPQIIRHR